MLACILCGLAAVLLVTVVAEPPRASAVAPQAPAEAADAQNEQQQAANLPRQDASDADDPFKPLTWADLVNRPERWPAQTKLLKTLRFSNATLNAGTAVRVMEVTARNVRLIAPQGFTFDASPDDCDLLQAANAQWMAFTPAQRALTLQAIQDDPSLWPAQVATTSAIAVGPQRVSAGTVLPLRQVKSNEVIVDIGSGLVSLSPGDTDLFTRSRQLAALSPEHRPNRFREYLLANGVRAGAAGFDRVNAGSFNGDTLFVVLYGNGECGWCTGSAPWINFSLDLIEQRQPGRLQRIFANNYGNQSAMQNYLRILGPKWIGTPNDNVMTDMLSSVPNAQLATPSLALLDSRGQVLALGPRQESSMDKLIELLRTLEHTLNSSPAPDQPN